MTNENRNWVDNLTEKAIDAGSVGQFRGFVCSGMGIALISATRAVPEEFELLYQVPCYVVFIVGLGIVVYRTIVGEIRNPPER